MAQWLRPCCYCRGPGIDSHHPHHGSQPSITPVLRDLAGPLFLPLWAPGTHMVHRCVQNNHAHNIRINKIKEIGNTRYQRQRQQHPGLQKQHRFEHHGGPSKYFLFCLNGDPDPTVPPRVELSLVETGKLLSPLADGSSTLGGSLLL